MHKETNDTKIKPVIFTKREILILGVLIFLIIIFLIGIKAEKSGENLFKNKYNTDVPISDQIIKPKNGINGKYSLKLANISDGKNYYYELGDSTTIQVLVSRVSNKKENALKLRIHINGKHVQDVSMLNYQNAGQINFYKYGKDIVFVPSELGIKEGPYLIKKNVVYDFESFIDNYQVLESYKLKEDSIEITGTYMTPSGYIFCYQNECLDSLKNLTKDKLKKYHLDENMIVTTTYKLNFENNSINIYNAEILEETTFKDHM